MRAIKNKGGFTLLELVLILAVLAILIGLAAPSLSAYYRSGKEMERQKQEELIQKALNQYYAYEGHFPDLDPLSDEPESGDVALPDEKKELLTERLLGITAVRIDSDPYNFYYDQTKGTIRLVRKER